MMPASGFEGDDDVVDIPIMTILGIMSLFFVFLFILSLFIANTNYQRNLLKKHHSFCTSNDPYLSQTSLQYRECIEKKIFEEEALFEDQQKVKLRSISSSGINEYLMKIKMLNQEYIRQQKFKRTNHG